MTSIQEFCAKHALITTAVVTAVLAAMATFVGARNYYHNNGILNFRHTSSATPAAPVAATTPAAPAAADKAKEAPKAEAPKAEAPKAEAK